ncbi:MAG: hypothetical protein SXQ77_03005 [Halobacteria archaeon]|nr:hypothetical protein [Halobacteria archaeon]
MANNEIAFVDGLITAAREILLRGADMLHQSVIDILPFAMGVTIRTPHPSPSSGFFFGTPASEPWASLYGYYSEVILPLTLLILAAAIGILMFSGTLGGLLSGYERSLVQRRLFLGFLFVLAWWGVGTLTLQFADGLATSIAPDVDVVAQSFSGALNPASASGGTVTRAILTSLEAGVILGMAFLYLLRWVGIYALMLGMPIAVALWVVNIGPFAYLSKMVEGLATKFIPLAFVSVPAAVLFRVGDLLFGSFVPANEFGHPIAPFILALGFPLLSVFVAYYIIFKIPSLRRTSSEEYTPVERESIEKGRVEMGDGQYRPTEDTVYTGRESVEEETPSGLEKGRGSYAVSSGGAARNRSYDKPTASYGSTGTRTNQVQTDLELSRDRISELGEE